MTDNWWQQRPNAINIKSLNAMVCGPCLAPPFNLGIPGLGGAQEDCTGSRGAGAALMAPLLTLSEVHS